MNPSFLLFVPSSLAAAALFQSPATAQSTTRVSVDSVGLQGNSHSYVVGSSASADGRIIAFQSGATNLVPGDTNLRKDVFIHDRQTGQTSRVSVNSSGAQANADSGMEGLAISANGRFVAFDSYATNLILVPGDTNGSPDIFVHDRQTGQTSRVSVDSAGIEGNHNSFACSISADGVHVAFSSFATNLVPADTNGIEDIFVHDRQTGQTSRVSMDSAGIQGNGPCYDLSISADGRFAAFASYATNLVPGDTNGRADIFVHDRQTRQTSRISVTSSGVQGNDASWTPSISSDGRHVAFQSYARNLVSGDSNGSYDCFVHDRQTGQTSRISIDSTGVQGNGLSTNPSIAADGRTIAFLSDASNLVPGDTNNRTDVFVYDRQTGQVSRVSLSSAGAQGDSYSRSPSISADGQHVVFYNPATNLVPGDTNGMADVFVHDRGATGPGLAKSGTCPGAITLTISNATAGSPVVIVHGPAGMYVKPAPPCQGLILGVSPPTLGALVSANGSGIAVFNFNAPPGACGLSVQAVDVTTCITTNVIVL